jgi:predicted CXXCH cytochrome family protein
MLAPARRKYLRAMSDRGRFGHKVSTYERPNQPFLCGRGGLWKTPCWQGPDAAGRCCGQSECTPARIADRWECRRPKRAGGTCIEGPMPDGTCGRCSAPCVPRKNVRTMRAHLSLVAAIALFLLLIVGIDPRANSVVSTAALDAGNLTSAHAGFTREQGCSACHSSHSSEGAAWLLAAFRTNDPSTGCTGCHDFAGPIMKAHNKDHPKTGDAAPVSCASCHTEHKGAAFNLAQVPDFACANCHQKRFDNFVGNHPAFPAGYPYTKPGRIYFDHSKHINDYFTDPKRTKGPDRDAKFAALAKTKCTACHSVENAAREVKPKPYAQICAGCHDAQIAKREFVLFEPDKVTPAASVLLGIERDGDEEAAKQRLSKLWAAMARSGAEAIAELAPKPSDAAKKQPSDALHAGLGGPVAREAGAAWSAGRAIAQTGAKPDTAGWSAGENSEGNPALFYRAAAHGDPVLKSWIETIRTGLADKDAGKRSIAKEAMNDFLDSQTGPGACGKCHSAALRVTGADQPAAWGYAGADPKTITRYTHAKHLGLLDPDAGCTTCHQMNTGAKYAKYFTAKASASATYESNFSGIRKETCVECHREGQVDSACQVCHAYHPPHRFNLGFRQKGGLTK